MKTLTLTILEKWGIRDLLNAVYGKGGLTLSMLTDAQNINKKIFVEIRFAEKPNKQGVYPVLGGKEAKAVDMKRVIVNVPVTPQNPTGQGGNITWSPEKDKGTPVELTQDEEKLIVGIITEKNSKKEFTIADTFMPTLAKKLELDLT